MTVNLNLGCGSHAPPHWLNVDYSLGARIAKLPLFGAINRRLRLFNIDWSQKIIVHDLRTRFPWSGGSVDAVYSSHTLEHLSREDGHRFLCECHRVLKPGGIIRIVVPDLGYLVDEYTLGNIPADRFVERLGVLSEGKGWKRRLAPFVQYPHQCMYDHEALLTIMGNVGFECAEEVPLYSRIPDIEKIELESRTVNAVIVEGIRP